MLEYELWGNTLESWGISILIIVGAVVVVKLISLFSRKVLKPFITRTPNHLDNVIYYSLESPIKFAVMLLGIWIAIHRLVYPDNFVKTIDNAYRILIVLDITWVFARLIGGLLEIYLRKESTGQTNKMMPIIKRTALVLVWIIGIVMALSNIGVNISALLGTLGIGGIAFALAAQDTVKNIFGAFTIFTDKPFNIGDTIRVSLTGDPVEEIRTAKLVLKTLGLRTGGIEVVSCPTCGRTKIDLIGLANQVEKMVSDIPLDIKVAVMGCVVNGPGEAKEADIGIAGGIGEGLLIKKGEIVKKIKEDELLETLRWELLHWNE